MTYITVKEASEKWNITSRRICILCTEGRIPGAKKVSKVWMIPVNAKKPEDRRKITRADEITPASIFLNPTYFENNVFNEQYAEAKRICDIQNEYLMGNLDDAYSDICSLLNNCKNNNYIVIVLIIKIIIAANLGKYKDYITSFYELEKLLSAGDNYNIERMLYRYQASQVDTIDGDLLNEDLFPELMPLISMYTAKRYINMILKGDSGKDVSILEIVSRELDTKNSPLICAYYHIIMAVYYNANNDKKMYEYHIGRALDILLPRKWYTPLAEYSATLNLDYINDIDPQSYKKITALKKIIMKSYIDVGIFSDVADSARMDMSINIKIGILLVQGKSNEEMANELGISRYKIKQHIDDLCAIAGVSSRKEVKEFIINSFQV